MNNTKAIDNYVIGNNGFEGFAVSKTLVNKLIPVGKTQQSLNKYNILDNDIKRNDDALVLKKLINSAHKQFISDVLNDLKLDWTELYNAWSEAADTKNKDILKKTQEKYRKTISKIFYTEEKFKFLFSEKLFSSILPEICQTSSEKELLNTFSGFTTYFTDFNNIRKYLYTDEEKHNTIAFRIVNENFDIFLKNCLLFKEIENKHPELCSDSNFIKLKDIINELKFPVTDTNLNEYNILISGNFDDKKCIQKGLNQIIKEYNDQNKSNISFFTKLYLNILSDKESLFAIEVFSSSADVVKAVQNYHTFFEGIFKEYTALGTPALDKIFINSKKLSILSNAVTGDFSLYKKAIQTYSDEKLKDYYSLKELNNFYYQWITDNSSVEQSRDISTYFLKLLSFNCLDLYKKIDFEKMTDIQKHKEQVIPVKEYLQSVLDFYNLLRLVELPENKETDIDKKYYNFIQQNKEVLSEIVPLYNKTRNYVTKSYKEQKKIKLNFDTPTLLKGWDVNKEYTNNSVIFHDKEEDKYYLGIFNANAIKPKFNKIEDSSFEKMYIKYIPSPNKMLPHIFFSEKGIKTYNPSEELLNKYKLGMYKKGENFDIDFCHELIDYYKSCIKNYESYKVFNFNFKNTVAYNDISEFYKDVSDSGFKLTMAGVNKNDIFTAVDNEQLFLFEIYNRHLAGKSHGKDIHTEYFKTLFDPDNNFIQLCGGAEIFYRPALAVKNITHKKGSYIVNKNKKNGLSIDNEIYKNIYNHLNYGKSLSNDAKTLLDSGEVVYKKADRNLVKDKRYTKENITFHLPIMLNYKGSNCYVKSYNEKVIETIKTEDVKILAINRGETNLISAVLIDKKGSVILRKNYNTINNVDYKDKLFKKEKERENSRINWQQINDIAKLKDGYLSLVINDIAKLMVENDAVLVLEDLSSDFVHSRAKIEKNIYQRFQTKLIEKLSFLTFKNVEKNDTGGIYYPYQLCPSIKDYKSNYLQFGWIFFLNPAYISKIVAEEKYVNVFNFFDIKNFKDRKDYLLKFKSIQKTKDGFEFVYSRKTFNELFDGEGILLCKGSWSIYNQKEKHIEKIDITDTLQKAFILIGCTEEDKDFLNIIQELQFSLINNTSLEMILNCIKIVSEKKEFILHEWQYNGISCDLIAAHNLALKMNYIINLDMNLGKYGTVQNIKTADFLNYLINKEN